MLGREARDALERRSPAPSVSGVADLEDARVVDADDVAGEAPPRRCSAPARGTASGSRGAISLPVRTCCTFIPRSKRPEQTRRKATRSRCARSMFAWILKTNAAEAARRRGRWARCSTCARQRRRHQLAERVEERLEAEVVDRAAEEHRRHLAAWKRAASKRVARGVEQLDLLAEARVASSPSVLVDASGRRAPTTLHSARSRRRSPRSTPARDGSKRCTLLRRAVVDAAEACRRGRWARSSGRRRCRARSRPRR